MKNYEAPKLDIIILRQDDIITESPNNQGNWDILKNGGDYNG